MNGISRFARGAGVFFFVLSYCTAATYAATEYLPDNYFLVPADVNADGRDDAFAQPRHRNVDPLVLLGLGNESPDLVWQRLADIDPALAWDAEQAVLLAGDFNGDGRDDIFLQGRAPSSLQAVLLANTEGRFDHAQQKFAGDYMGFDWAGDARHALVGDFDGNKRDELFLQGYSENDIHSIVRPDANGVLNTSGPAWIDSHLNLRWNAVDAEVHAGDFNGDGRTDLLWRRLAETPRGDEPAVALVLADADGEFLAIAQRWEEDFLGAEWDPDTHAIEVADINHDGIADIVLRARDGRGTNYLVPGRLDGRFSEVALRWEGTESARSAWQAQGGGTPDIVMNVQQTVTTDGAQKSLDVQMQAPSALNGNIVGTLPGEFSVDPTGAANYRIPISVPPGVGGMQPDLAFLYSSRAGNGLLGHGWSLSGLSAITRCPASPAQAGSFKPVTYTNADRFCLDGQLLNLADITQTYGASGTVYGTEIASFQRVVAQGGTNSGTSYTGPAYFTVKDKAGLIREYGNSTDSRIKVYGKSVTKQWSLNRISDRYGNYIHFKYASHIEDGMRMYVPDEIAWYNNAGVLIGKVVMAYEDRTDVVKGAEPLAADRTRFGNSLFKRLQSAKVYARGAMVREYRLGYTALTPSGVSALDAVTLCDAYSNCLRPTEFTWSQGSTGFTSTDYQLRSSTGSALSLANMRLGDLNADGRVDVIHYPGGNLGGVDIGTFDPISTGLSLDGMDHETAVVVDFNRDGYDDVVLTYLYPTGYLQFEKRFALALSNGSGGYTGVSTTILARGYDSGSSPVPLDIDSDGYPELVFIDDGKLGFFANNAGSLAATPTWISGHSFSSEQKIIPIEYDGDGRPDILVTATDTSSSGGVFGSNGQTLVYRQEFRAKYVLPMDWNGDGLTDLIAKGGVTGYDGYGPYTKAWHRVPNAGGSYSLSTLAEDEQIPNTGDDQDDEYRKAKVIDWNRDGRAELLRYKGNSWYIDSYDPAASNPWSASYVPFPANDPDYTIVTEANGDGVGDILFKKDGVWRVRLGKGDAPGFMVRVENGLGDVHTTSYWNLNRPAVAGGEDVYAGHVPDAATHGFYFMNAAMQSQLNTGTARFFNASMPVVSAVETSTGVTSGNAAERILTTYRYGGAVMDVRGRGFLGFRMMRVKNSNTGIETVNLHRQDFPYTGMVETALQKIADVSVTTVTSDPIDSSCYNTRGEPVCGFGVVRETTTTVGNIVSKTVNTFDLAYVGLTPFPYAKTTTETSYRFPWPTGSTPPIDRVVKTTYSYGKTPDVNGEVTGDPTQIIVETSSDGTSGTLLKRITTNNKYEENDLDADWCLGRLTESSVRHYRSGTYLPENDGDLDITRIARFHYDASRTASGEKSCRLKQEISDATSPSLTVTKTHALDSFGNVTATTVDAAVGGTRVTSRAYDQYGLFPVMTQNTLGHQEFYVWDHRFGKKRASTGPNGLTSVWDYDSFGRLARETSPRTNVYTDYTYAWCGSSCISSNAVYFVKAKSSIGSNAYTITEYDRMQREVATRAPNGLNTAVIAKETAYDGLGRPYLVSLPYETSSPGSRCWIHTQYDLLGRPKVMREPANDAGCAAQGSAMPHETAAPAAGGKRTTYTYDGLVTTVTAPGPNGGNRVMITTRNAADHVLSVQENGSASLVTRYDYDAQGNTTTVIPPGGAAVHIRYDDAGRKTSMSDPDMGDWSYVYNGFGELTGQVDARNNRIEMDYDALGRMIARRDIPQGESAQLTRWTYDNGYGASIGKLVHVVQADGYEETYAYNEYGQPTDTVRLVDGEVYWTTQTYDPKGRPDILVYPDVSTFDAANTTPVAVSLTVPAENYGSVAISWSRLNPFATYRLYRSTNDTTYNAESPIYTGPLTAFTDTVTANGTYYYWLHACHGETCATSGPAASVTTLPPPPPGWLTVPDYNGYYYALSWGASEGATSYVIEHARSIDGTYTEQATVEPAVVGGVPPTSFNVPNLGDGEHYFQVRACNAFACSKPTRGTNPGLSVVLPPAMGAATINPVITGDGRTTVSWAPSADGEVNAYEIERRRVNSDGSTSSESTYQAAASPLSVNDVPVGRFKFRVRACKALNGSFFCGGWGGLSDELDSGIRPSKYTSLENPTSNEGGTFTLTFTNAVNWHSSLITVEEAADEAFTLQTRNIPVTQQCERIIENGEDLGEICHNPTSVQVTGAPAGLRWYRIRACNGQYGCSDWRVTAHATDVLRAPGMPSSLDVPTLGLAGSYEINWGESSGTGKVSRYELFESSEYSDFSTAVGAVAYSGPALVHPVSGKGEAERYWYGVRACYKSYCSNFRTDTNGVTVRYKPTTPPTISAPATSMSGNYSVYWSEPASGVVTAYELQESDDATFATVASVTVPPQCVQYSTEPGYEHLCERMGPGTVAPVSDKPNGSFHYRVRACNEAGCSGWRTHPDPVLVQLPPGRVGSLTAPTNSDGTHALSWTAPSGVVTRYELFEATSSDYSGQIRVYNSTGLSKTLSGRADDRYYYRVRACNGDSCGSYRDASNSVVVINIPGVPPSITVPVNSASGAYLVSWSAASGVVSNYVLEESTDSSFTSTDTIAVPQVCTRYSTEPGYEHLCEQMGPGTSVGISGRGDGTYYYRVKACNSSGCSTAWRTGANGVSVLNPPGRPASLTAPPSSNGSVALNWSAASGAVGRYELYEATQSNYTDEVRVYNSGGTSVTLSGRVDDRYYYRVRACNASGCSAYRNADTSVVVLNPPGVPGTLSLPATNPTGSYTISWSAATGAVTSYELQESESSTFSAVTGISVPTVCVRYSTEPGYEHLCEQMGPGTSASVTGRANGTYYYRVRACNGSGCSSWRNGSAGVEVLHKPGTPSSITVPTSSDGTHTISWGTASGVVSSYELYESTSSSFSGQVRVYSGSSLSKALSKPDDRYYYRVRACNASGCSGYRTGSNSVSVVNPPGTPGSISVPSSNSTGSYTVSWSASSGVVTSYVLQESTSSSFSSVTTLEVPRVCTRYSNEPGYEHLCEQWGPGTAVAVTGRANGTYYYRVRACNANCSSWRTSGSVTVNRTPGTPSSISSPSSSSTGSYSVSWGASSGTVTAYKLYEATNSSFSGQTLVYSGTSRSKSLSGRSNGTYYYRVRACNGSYCSGYRSGASTTVSIYGGGGPQPCYPGQPCQDPLQASAPVGTTGVPDVSLRDAAVVKVAGTRRDGFRAMAPMRPADFYRGLRVGLPRGEVASARAVRTSSTSRTKAAQQPLVDADNNIVPMPVEAVAPLRRDPRIGGQTATTKSLNDTDVVAMKFDHTNEPDGTYAHAVKHTYHAVTGMLVKVQECVANTANTGCDTSQGQVYWEAKAVNASGDVTLVKLGNGLSTWREIDRVAGVVKGIQTGASNTDGSLANAMMQNLVYAWDIAGNLKQRRDLLFNNGTNGGFVEDFVYDGLSRLVETHTDYNLTADATTVSRYTFYHANGNIRCFNIASTTCGTGDTYTYDASHPHAVQSTPASATPYGYDANGSMTSGPDGRVITWTAFNKAARIEAGGKFSSFIHGPDRARYRHVQGTVDSSGADIVDRVTTYIGSRYERVETAGATVHRFHIFAAGSAVAVYSCSTSCGADPQGNAADGTRDETLYLHRDHLGSINVITDGHGVEKERFTYTAWGVQQRWNPNIGTGGAVEPASSTLQARGFTGHEMLNELGLVHMNGRIYDQNIGRFISADPFVQFEKSTQGYARYSYVNNNPLSYTDPSGYFLDKLVKAVGIVLNFVPGCQLWCSTIWGAVSGYLMTGSFKGALIGAVGAAVFSQIGSHFGNNFDAFSSKHFAKMLAHGLAGGALSAAGGGRFGDGFLGAATAQLFAPAIDAIGMGDDGSLSSDFGSRLGRVIAAAAVGGTAAKLGGGNFGNGAATAAFARLFNDEHTINEQNKQSETVKLWRELIPKRVSSQEELVEYYRDPEHAVVVMADRVLHLGELGVGNAEGLGAWGLRAVDLAIEHQHVFIIYPDGQVDNLGFTKGGVFEENLSEGGVLKEYKFRSGSLVSPSVVRPIVQQFRTSNFGSYNVLTNNCQDFCTAFGNAIGR